MGQKIIRMEGGTNYLILKEPLVHWDRDVDENIITIIQFE